MRITTLVAASLAAVAVAAPAAAADTLVGEQLTSAQHTEAFGYTGVCNPDGPSTFEWGSFGEATGPHAGQYEAYGTVTLASPSGPVTAFDAAYTIHETEGDGVSGTQTLAASGPASCTAEGENSSFSIELDATYDVLDPFAETGPAQVSMTGIWNGGTFAATFGPEQQEPQGPQTKDDCKDGGWATYGFANQGQCIKAVNHRA